MNIADKKVVTIEYTLKDDGGEVLDSSDGREPLVYIQGIGNLVPGLEKALDGKGAGDAVNVSVPASEAYGEYDKELIERIQLRRLPEKNIQVGMRFRAQTEDGIRFLLVTAIEGDYATVDGNHPLAGKTLHFAVKVVGVREATEEELTHGHVHGEGGHHHH